MSNDDVRGKLLVSVRSRQGLVYSGTLAALTAFNQVGKFDILPQHANFVSMIFKRLILHREDGRREELNMEKGILLVEKNKVQIFLGIGAV